MKNSEGYRWVVVRNSDAEHLLRFSVSAENFCAEVPGVGSIWFDAKRKRWVSDLAGLDIQEYTDGEAIHRKKNLELERLPSVRKEKIAWLSGYLCLALCFPFFRGAEPGETKMIPKIAQTTPTPFSPRFSKSPDVSVIPKRKERSQERRIRQLFIQGDLQAARLALSEAEMLREPSLSSSFQKLAQEVHYAVCLRFSLQNEWKKAEEECGCANKYGPHRNSEKIRSQINSKAKKFFLEGYAMEGIDSKGAIEKYRQSARYSSVNKYAIKARQKLKAIEEVRSR